MTYAASPAPLTFDSVGDAFNRYAPVMDLGWSDWLTITQPMLDALGGAFRVLGVEGHPNGKRTGPSKRRSRSSVTTSRLSWPSCCRRGSRTDRTDEDRADDVTI